MYKQQGDVLIVKIDSLPAGAHPAKHDHRGIVLAEGEATGHAHVIADVAEAEAFTLADAFFVKVTGNQPVTVTHEEHGPVSLDPGVWRVAIVREYDHFKEESTVVRD